jgi:hypothetical protein
MNFLLNKWDGEYHLDNPLAESTMVFWEAVGQFKLGVEPYDLAMLVSNNLNYTLSKEQDDIRDFIEEWYVVIKEKAGV